MTTKTLEDLLAESAFFKDLDPSYRGVLAGCASNVVFQAGEYILREGDESRRFFLLRAGKVSVEIRVPGQGAMMIQSLEAGEVLGWSWMVPPYKKYFDVRAVELSRALAFDGACLGKKCEDDPKLGYEFFKRFATVMAQRLTATRLQLLDVYAKR